MKSTLEEQRQFLRAIILAASEDIAQATLIIRAAAIERDEALVILDLLESAPATLTAASFTNTIH